MMEVHAKVTGISVMRYVQKTGREWAVSLALFALLLQFILPLGQAQALTRTVDDGFSNRTIICTLYGPRIVYDASGREVPPEEGGDVPCPTCLAHAIGSHALNNTVEIVIPQPVFSASVRAAIEDVVAEPLTAATSYHSRAPPLSI